MDKSHYGESRNDAVECRSNLSRLARQLREESLHCQEREKLASLALSLESRAYQMETETIASIAAKRHAEQELEVTQARITALEHSHSLKQKDLQQALEFSQSQVKSKSQEIISLRKEAERLSLEVSQLKAANQNQQGISKALENDLRGRVSSLERNLEEANQSLQLAEHQAKLSKTAHADSKKTLEKLQNDNQATKEHNDKLSQEIVLLKNELTTAKDQLKAIEQKKDRSLFEALDLVEASKEESIRCASLIQECKGLRSEVSRLQSILLDERTSRERDMHQMAQKLESSLKRSDLLKTQLETKVEALRASEKAEISSRAEAERAAQGYIAEIASLRDKLKDGRREVEQIRRQCQRETEAIELCFQEKTRAALESASSAYRRRIQDLELQLSAMNRESNDSERILGGYASSILDYIPKSEHVRLLQMQVAAREAELESSKAEILKDADGKVEVMHKELLEAKKKLQEATDKLVEHRQRVAESENKVSLLTIKLSDTEAILQKVQAESDKHRLERETIRSKLASQGELLEATQTNIELLKRTHNSQIKQFQNSLHLSIEAKNLAEKELSMAKVQSAKAMSTFKRRCEQLQSSLKLLRTRLKKAEDKFGRTKLESQRKIDELRRVAHDARAKAENAQDSAQFWQKQAEIEKEKNENSVAELECKGGQILTILSLVEKQLGISTNGQGSSTSSILGFSNNFIDARISAICSRARELVLRAQDATILSQRTCRELGALQETLTGGGLTGVQQKVVNSVGTTCPSILQSPSKRSQRLSSLSQELENLKARVDEQAVQVDAVEEKERELGMLASKLAASVTAQSHPDTSIANSTNQLQMN